MLLSGRTSPHTRSRRKTLPLPVSDYNAKREKKGSLSFVRAVYLAIVILFLPHGRRILVSDVKYHKLTLPV